MTDRAAGTALAPAHRVPSGAPDAQRIRALRRTPQQSQLDFTALLDVLARPGRVRRLAVPDAAPAAAVAACGLIDVEVPVHVLTDPDPDSAAWADAVYAATGAQRAELPAARTVIALRPLSPEDIATLNRGTPLDPEIGARVFAQVDALGGEGPHDTELLLTGPGVPDGTQRRLTVRGLTADTVTALAAANAAFPRGVDLFLTTPDGAVAGLPRTTRVRRSGKD
ncbi:phosphonate C-P lyase system protein PhnH [Streptomyces malaysiensis]|uniref:Phosphonate C-P lyase system protein PhnH n=1 Tax=Streptomyces malaysiensis TaxID=92644 RepID=A0ABX6VZJ6_STRMQ|nr:MULTISPECIES: phosphonate C-P lyase system protein PhnH [Streptomyces]AUA16711.1 carbon-phosphorus lyase complex subunit [Streptomyces sp. M56]QPI53840.1 phosphonate C-P lyase system protein PhnH [Streptomyces solisilvae]UHH15202.1 phosphonate C-P lyase system protein PhnH [Streptomyces sp. HNM0561]WHX23621.1 phosphonate C-P lyase system protein PhnH [Streptomyces sp. NA07423]